jgi:hypothetical protein
MSRTLSDKHEEMQNIGRFYRLCNLLLSPRYCDYLDKTLAFWILPTDRRLPLALLSRNLGDLLHTSYEDLAKTPGIGQKKMCSLIMLLARAVNAAPEESSSDSMRKPCTSEFVEKNSANARALHKKTSGNGFDASCVTELQWSQWRAMVIQHGLGGEVLGRYAASLQKVKKVIWNTPLSDFAACTLAELRSMKAYGEKRMQTILEVFHDLQSLLAGLGTQPHLTVRIVSPLIDQIEQWVGGILQTPGIPDENDILERFIRPLLRQIEIDALPQIVTLAENRLGIFGSPCSVRQAARTMGLTRARVYQLLNEINDIAVVRWPLGRHLVHEMRQKFERESASMNPPPDLTRFHAAVELIFPGNRRGAEGPLEYVAVEFEEEQADLVEA